MKLRLHSNALRLRLSQSEVTRLAETGHVEESIAFAPGRVLSYAIECGGTDAVVATFDNDVVRVVLPENVAKTWTGTDQVGIEASSGPLHVLIEKDYQCLHRSSPEDADSFPNPMASRS
jgi:hypothetical protein